MNDEPILTMPTYLGQQMYPGGFPLRPDSINVEGVSVQERFLRYGTGAHVLKEDEEVLCNYMRYYLRAPIWRIEGDLDKVTEMNYDQLFDLCMDNGLDPF